MLFDSCVDGIKLFQLGELSRALFPTAHVHLPILPDIQNYLKSCFCGKRSASPRRRFGPVSFSSSCQCGWRWAAPTAVGSTCELGFCSAAESKRLTFAAKSSLFNDGESLCAAMLPSSDPPSTARRTRWRQSCSGSWVVEREASPLPFFPLLTLWKAWMTTRYETNMPVIICN